MFRHVAVGLAALAVAASAAVAEAASPANSTRIDPGDFVSAVDNPWWPQRPETVRVYRGVSNGKPSRTVVTVTMQTKTILGVRCVVVHDHLYVEGRIAERTSDWYAQDRNGNVWYFGEATAELDRRGRVITTKGSWEAGVDGAQPGIVMPAHPKPGQSFRQEYYKGHAEDHFEIVSLTARVSTPYISSRRALLTREWTPLEPHVTEHKYYVRGIGLVEEPSSELVSVKTR